MTRRRFASGLKGKSASSGRLNRGVARPKALMLLLRSLFRCRKALPEAVIGGLPAPCKNFFALGLVDGVEGGRLAEYGVPGPVVDADIGKPALGMVPGVEVMLRPPHLGHRRFSESDAFADVEPEDRLLFLPFRRG